MNIADKPGGKHILFVNLAHLHTNLLSLREDWNITLVSTAAEALQVVVDTHVDVLVADFHIPHMDGVELLNAIKKIHPKTIRFIMSASTDREAVLKRAGHSHFFLSTPLDMGQLKTAIERALTLREAMDDQKMAAIISDIKPMPTVPLLYDQITRALSSDFSSLADIAKLISKDVSMSAKILQLVNSAFFGLKHRADSVWQATFLLGGNTIKGLVLGAGVFEKFSPTEMKLFDVQMLYTHSVEVSGLTHLVSEKLHKDHELQDLAALTGMMHDFGKIILMRSNPSLYHKVYRKSREEKRAIHEVELELLGVTHAEVGAYVLRQWGLPEIVVEAIALHHKPSRNREQLPNMLTAVHIANALAHRTMVDGQESLSKLDHAYIESLNLQDSVQSISKCLSTQINDWKSS